MVPFLDLTRQYEKIKSEILAATQRVYKKGRFILGEEVSGFEKEFSHYCGVRYGVGVGSGTDALYLALKAAGIGEGDQVVTVANSFVATALAISFTGAKPLFVDIDPKAYTMDPNSLELLLKREKSKRSGRKIRAVLPVHLYGHPAEMDSIVEIANRYDLVVIEDACQAHGAKFGRRKVGSLGAMGCFSFYPTKNLGGYGDGGMVVTDNDEAAAFLRLYRNHGLSDRDHVDIWGVNSRLQPVQAVVATRLLDNIEELVEARIRNARRLDAGLQNLAEFVQLPPRPQGYREVYQLYLASFQRREALLRRLAAREIEARVHYPIPLHLQRAAKDLGYKRGDFPVCERQADEIVTLPAHQHITADQIDYMLEVIHRFYRS